MRRNSVKVALTALMLASTLPIHAATEQEVLVSVLDRDGKPVTDLTPRDIAVREDGVLREVLRVRRATEPMTVALLVDDSAAASTATRDIRTAVTDFLDALDPKHEIALITFGERSSLLVDYTRDRKKLKDAADRVFARTAAGAYILDAITDASRGLERRKPRRPVIVAVLTEGIEFSNLTYPSVLRRLFDSGAQFHALVLGTGVQVNPALDEVRNRNIVLDEGTRGTGGRRDQLLTSIALPATMKELAAELENQYIVTYSRPDALIPPQHVQVEAKREGMSVRARTRLEQEKSGQ
jgi:VWFA-related protein